MAFPQTPLVVTIELFLEGAWVDISDDVYLRNRIQITWGRQDWAATADTTKCQLTINNRLGKYTPKNTASPHYGQLGRNTKIRITVDSSVRFEGRVSSWPTRWDVSGKDVYVGVQANGVRRRLSQGVPPVRDPLRRFIEASAPLAYWPMTDGEDARQGSEIVGGGQPIRAIGTAGSFFQGQPGWGKGTLATWLDAAVELPSGTTGRLTTTVRPQALDAWAADHFRNGVGGTEDDFAAFDNGEGTNADPVKGWIIAADATTNVVELRLLSAGETITTLTTLATVSNPGIFDLSPHMLRVTAARNGGSTDWTLVIDGVTRASGTQAVAFRPPLRLRYRWGQFTGLPEAMQLGHIAYWETPPDATDTYQALLGHARELAGRRIERLCAEQGVPLAVHGNLDQTPPMGPQRSGSFLDLLQSAADVDGGVLHESRDVAGLAYRTQRSKYNQGV
ncbi:hypothetical protein ABZ208_35335 [Streptomyces sp. NPDC006208]|uniref:hypothetical protein n=1 Tax=Streptomyces sp. NPDC006208 TaxID=3156734 RepID=UPI0033A77EEE